MGIAVVVAACGGTGPAPSTSVPPATTAPSTTSTSPSTAQPSTAIWPFASTTVRYTSPIAAARGFARTYLGFSNPVVGPFQQGDSRSGEVEVRASPSGVVTTVLVRMLAPGDTWWVLGSVASTLALHSPAALSPISSPVTLTGESTAFEGTINLELRQDGTLTPLATATTQGGSKGQMGPFTATVSFPSPVAGAGAIVVRTISAEDGATEAASTVRIAYAR
jgi:hypothetical protein